MLELSLGVRRDEIKSLTSDTWILIDDAQLAFEAEIFWKLVVKDFEALTESTSSLRLHTI
jgi:hypothetical protein